jgi:prepilin-type N-terminal cleavage/methylation domain-containing protein
LKKLEDGFTLIELTLVVLILGILVALAIPTFVSTSNSAKARGPESNLSIALTDESVYYQEYGGYGSTATPSITTIDPGINWVTCPVSGSCVATADTGGRKAVYVLPATDSGFSAVVLGAAGSSGSNYWVLVSQNPTGPSPEYLLTSSATPPTPATFRASPSTTWPAT